MYPLILEVILFCADDCQIIRNTVIKCCPLSLVILGGHMGLQATVASLAEAMYDCSPSEELHLLQNQ